MLIMFYLGYLGDIWPFIFFAYGLQLNETRIELHSLHSKGFAGGMIQFCCTQKGQNSQCNRIKDLAHVNKDPSLQVASG